MGLLGLLVTSALVAVGGTAAVGAYLYATDYGLEADVQSTDCRGPTVEDLLNSVAVKTRVLGIDHAVKGIPDDQCSLLEQGDRVVYHVRSKHTILYRGDQVCYDSETGGNPACIASRPTGLLS